MDQQTKVCIQKLKKIGYTVYFPSIEEEIYKEPNFEDMKIKKVNATKSR